MKTKNTILLFSLLFFLFSCSNGSNVALTGEGDDNLSSAQFLERTPDDFQGNWSSGCYDDSGEGSQFAFNITGQTFAMEYHAFDTSTDPTCSEGYKLAVFTLNGEIKVHAQSDTIEPFSNVSHKVDIVVGEILMEPSMQTFVDMLNYSETCGYSDWAVHQSKDVSGCLYETDYLFLSQGMTWKNRFVIGDNINTLYLFMDGPVVQENGSDNGYPATVDEMNPVTRD